MCINILMRGKSLKIAMGLKRLSHRDVGRIGDTRWIENGPLMRVWIQGVGEHGGVSRT